MKNIECSPDVMVTHMKCCTKEGGDILTIAYEDGSVDLIMNRNWVKRM